MGSGFGGEEKREGGKKVRGEKGFEDFEFFFFFVRARERESEEEEVDD